MLTKSSFWTKHKKGVIRTIVIVALIGIAFVAINMSKPVEKVVQARQRVALAQIGDISTSITGSGVIESASTKEIASEVAATVNSVLVKIGDRVNKGDVLIELDTTDYDAKIRELQKNINKLSKSVEEYKEDISNLNVYAKKSGYVSDLKCNVGDSINKNSTIYSAMDNDSYYLTVPFYYNSSIDIKAGNSVKILLNDTFTYIDGVVTYVSDKKEVVDSTSQSQDVEIRVDNPGYSLFGLRATATVQTGTVALQAIKVGTFDYPEAASEKSLSSGTVKKLNIRNGQYVNKGELVMVLENDDLSENLSDAQSNLNDAYESLNDAKSDSSFYTITAPIDGIITELKVNEDDYVRNETTLGKIVNNYDIEFTIDVDELNILDVKLDQEVKVTIDAIAETTSTPVIGKVTEIAIEGTSMNSVTSYPVTISLEGNDKIKMGMNVSASIVIESKEDVITVPVEAITTRRNKNYVTLENGTEQEVEVGIYNEDYIEIISGLSNGDKIILPSIVEGTTTTKTSGKINSSFNMSGGMQGGMTGGMPGGMQGGGMPRGM